MWCETLSTETIGVDANEYISVDRPLRVLEACQTHFLDSQLCPSLDFHVLANADNVNSPYFCFPSTFFCITSQLGFSLVSIFSRHVDP